MDKVQTIPITKLDLKFIDPSGKSVYITNHAEPKISDKEKEMSKPDLIIHMASKHFGIPSELITMPDKKKGARIKAIVDARHASMRLIKDHTTLSLKNIGEIFSGRDHSTVIHGLEKIENRLYADKEFSKVFKSFEHKINSVMNPTFCLEKRYEKLGYVFV